MAWQGDRSPLFSQEKSQMPDVHNIGAVGIEIRATRDKLKGDLQAAEADLKAFGDRTEREIGDNASGIGGKIGRMAATAVTAVTALVGVIGLAASGLFKLGMAGQKMGSDIADGARRIGVGVDALQEWRHVAQRTGEDANAADRALEAFSKRFSEAASGMSKDAAKAFEALGISRDQLKGFDTVEAALDATVDRIGDLESAADQSAIAERLGLGPLSVALVRGADDIARLRDEAHELGVVMDRDMIQRAEKAQREFDTLSRVVGINLKSAFVDLAPVLLTAISLVADLARSLGDALDQWRDLENKTSTGIRRVDQQQAVEQVALIDRFGSRDAMRGQIVRARPIEGVEYSPLSARQTGSALARGAPNLPSAERDPSLNFWQNIGRNSTGVVNAPQYVDAQQHFDALNRQRVANAGELASRVQSPPANNRGGGALNIPTPTRTNQRQARAIDLEALRTELEIQNALDVARASGDAAAIKAVEDKLDLVRLTAAFERAGVEDAAGAAKTQMQAIAVAAEAAARREALKKREAQALRDEEDARERLSRLAATELQDRIEIARLSGEEGLLRSLTREEAIRRRIAEMVRLTGISEADARAGATSIEDAKDDAARVGRLREDFRHAFTDGVAAAIDGDLGSYFESLADRFTDRMLDNLADDLFDLLSEAAKGMGGESGGGGWLAAIGSLAFGGGRASGGQMTGGNWYRVGEHGPENIVMPRDGFAIPNGAIAGQSQGRNDGGALSVHVTPSPYFDVAVERVAAPLAAQAGATAYTAGQSDQARAMRGRRQSFV